MTGREAINLLLNHHTPAQVYAWVTEQDKESPGSPTPDDESPTPGEKPFPGAKTPFGKGGKSPKGEADGYKPGSRGDEGHFGDDSPYSGVSPSPGRSPSPGSPSPGSPGMPVESRDDFLARMFEEYGIDGDDHDPETQSPAGYTPTPDDEMGESYRRSRRYH